MPKKNLEELEKKSDVFLGKQLDLFCVDPLVGKGLPMLLPKGATIRRVLERFIVDEEIKRGYQHVYTPFLGKLDLYKLSGHWPYYKDSMYDPISIDKQKYILRPMTCPHHFMIFKCRPRSYRELPLRIAEIASQNRKEQSGELRGLMRVRSFMLADSHIFCAPEQLQNELTDAMKLAKFCLDTLGFKGDYWIRLALPDTSKKFPKDRKMWEDGVKALRNALKAMKIKFVEKKGEAAFYGPKADFQIKNIFGKEDTIITVQVDLLLSKRFKLKYMSANNKYELPVVIHRSSIGCIERTIGFLIEKYQGAFPVWLSPVQVKLISFTDRNLKYAQKVEKSLREAGIRMETDYGSTTVQGKVRDAELEKVPYILVVGDKEQKNNTIAVRTRGKKKLEFGVKIDTFIKRLNKEIETRKLIL